MLEKELKSLLQQLSSWRLKWEKANIGAASECTPSDVIPRPDVSSPQAQLFYEMMARKIEFETLSQALDILTYNAGLMYIIQLNDIREKGQIQENHLTPADIVYIKKTMDAKSSASPLLLPYETRLLCQPAIESFRFYGNISKQLMTNKETILIILAPLGIIYCALKGQPELRRIMDQTIAQESFDKNILDQLRVFDITWN